VEPARHPAGHQHKPDAVRCGEGLMACRDHFLVEDQDHMRPERPEAIETLAEAGPGATRREKRPLTGAGNMGRGICTHTGAQ